MTAWSEQELSRIGAAYELYVSTRRSDGSLRHGIPIWQVRVGDAIYIRSAHGPQNGWFRRALATGAGHGRSGGVERDVTFERRRLAPRCSRGAVRSQGPPDGAGQGPSGGLDAAGPDVCRAAGARPPNRVSG